MSHSLDCAVLDIDWTIMKLDAYYEESCPEHDRTSCSDDEPNNAMYDGTGCRRCTAIALTQLGRLRAENSEQALLIASLKEKYELALCRIVNHEDLRGELTQQLSNTQRQNAELMQRVGEAKAQFQYFVDAKQSPDWPDFNWPDFAAWVKSRSAFMVSTIAASKVSNDGDRNE